MVKKYYKVVTKINSKYMSALSYFMPGWFPVEYQCDKFVFSRVGGSKLFVFNKYEEAERFMNDCYLYFDIHGYYLHNVKCFEVDVKNPQKSGPFVDGYFSMAMKDILISFLDTVLTAKRNKKAYKHLCDKPLKNTVFVDAVKLIKEV